MRLAARVFRHNKRHLLIFNRKMCFLFSPRLTESLLFNIILRNTVNLWMLFNFTNKIKDLNYNSLSIFKRTSKMVI